MSKPDYFAQVLERPRAVFPAGRFCSRRGCEVKLSRYNAGPNCWIHSPPRIPARDDSCGTESGYKRHRRHHETPCNPCRDGAALAKAIRYRRRQEAV